MKKYFVSLLCILSLLALPACRKEIIVPPEDTDPPSGEVDPGGEDPGGGEEPGEGDPVDFKVEYPATCGISYLYDTGDILPEMHISVPLEEWNKLLDHYDEDKNNKKSVLCNVRYVKGGEESVVEGAALRLRGNTSRRRPEGERGTHHTSGKTHWRRCHFQINFHKYHKDEAHEIQGARKVILKFFNGDAAYVREIYCYDLFRRAGVWTASYSTYCRVFVQVEGDPEEAYFGVYSMIEPVDERYLKVRKSNFGSRDGYLWKCRYGASLNPSKGGSIGPDNEEGIEYTYELKTRTEELDAAQAVLKDFMNKFNSLSGPAFHDWVARVCDVQLLLRTYAVNVAVGMWDDYWNNTNNYYIYFTPDEGEGYRFFFIPYDYDNTLGTSLACGVQLDAAFQNPLHWGVDSNPLIYKILQYDDYLQIYCEELLRLIDPGYKLLWYEYSGERISAWEAMIAPYIRNDTGEGQSVQDIPATWGNRSQYRILDPSSPNNYFKVKAMSIENYCGK